MIIIAARFIWVQWLRALSGSVGWSLFALELISLLAATRKIVINMSHD